jgi:hypothetical protein
MLSKYLCEPSYHIVRDAYVLGGDHIADKGSEERRGRRERGEGGEREEREGENGLREERLREGRG